MTARARDRRVYLAGHPFLFVGSAAIRRQGLCRIGSRVVVNDPDAVRRVLTELPLDRVSARTTGGAIRRHDLTDALFDETGADHRSSRRVVARRLDASGVAGLRPMWTPVLRTMVERLRSGEMVDVCSVADEMSGRTTAVLLGLDMNAAECVELAVAARRTAASAAAAEIPSWRRVRFHDHVADLLGDRVDSLGIMLAMAAITTTHATVPRAVAWVADDGLWAAAGDAVQRPILVGEMLRVLAPTPLLPRVLATSADIGRCPVTPDDQLLLMVRHAVGAHRRGPSVTDPAPASASQLVFGAGRHACPGAGLARAQLGDVLEALAPVGPRVVRARADRRSALPAWRSMMVAT